MKISSVVEPLVREAIAAAVGQEVERYDRAILRMTSNGDRDAVESINLGLSIAGFALFDLHDGARPNGTQIARLASMFSELESWVEIEESSVVEILTALTEGRQLELSPANTAFSVFVIDAWLLSAFGAEDREWHHYLDQILMTMESSD